MTGSNRIARIVLCLTAAACAEADGGTLSTPVSRTHFKATLRREGTLEAKKAQVLRTPRVWPQPTIGFLAPEGSKVKKDEVVVQFESEEIERRYMNALNDKGIAKAKAAQREAQMAMDRLMQQSAEKSAQATADIARLKVAQLGFVAPTLKKLEELRLRKAELQAEKARKKLANLDAIEKEERSKLEAETQKAELERQKQERFLKQLTLRAPTDGIVVYERNRMTGDRVKEGDGLYGGMPVVKIPDPTVMQVKLSVSEVDAQKLKVDQPAIVLVPAVGDKKYPAKVSRVGKRAAPIKKNSKVKRVKVIVEIEGTHAELVSGMSAVAEIVVSEVPDAFVVPADCVFEQDSLKVVYVREGSSFRSQPVTVDTRGEDFVVVSEGLEDGVFLALREPSNSELAD